MTKFSAYQNFYAQRQTLHQARSLRETVLLPGGKASRDGVTLDNFSSNDYMGLSHHPWLRQRAREYIDLYGTGATASRLVTGNLPAYTALEQKIAAEKGQPAALILGSGYQANLSVLAALLDKDVLKKSVTVLADRFCHHSLLQGALLGAARLMRFHHNDYDHLEQLLKQHTGHDKICFIITESVFGMDGDQADLTALVALARCYDAMLYVDEAHATGVFGARGFGLAAEFKSTIDVVMGTFGKALGSFGAYIACDQSLRDYLIQRCGGLIYSTGLPPAVLGSIDAALELLPSLTQERDELQRQAARVRQALRHQGWNCGASTTQIIPVILGSESAATDLSQALIEKGILAPAIRPPTVPRGTSRLRLSLSAAHTVEALDQLLDVMGQLAPVYAASSQATLLPSSLSSRAS